MTAPDEDARDLNDPARRLHQAGLLSPISGDDASTWIAHHHAHHDGDWGPCMDGMCGVVVRIVQAWEEAVRPKVAEVLGTDDGPLWGGEARHG